jgi:hypothetical protein
LFYKNKETKQIVLLVKSDSKKSIIFEYDEKGVTTGGKILSYSKKEFKKMYIKDKKCTFQKPNENMIETILTDYETNRYAYDNNFEEYVENQKYLDRKEEIEKQTEADRRRLLKELADDYNPNGIKVPQNKG